MVKNLVKRIWDDRITILLAEDTTADHSDTIEARCYTYYASSTPTGTQATASSTLDLTQLDGIATNWSFNYSDEQKGTFRHYLYDIQIVGSVQSLIYINAKPSFALTICRDKLFPLFGTRKVPERQRLARVVGARAPQLHHGPALVTSYAGKVYELKLAEGTEAYTSRREKIVVYATVKFDEAVAIAKSLNITNGHLENPVPPMTFEVLPGVAVGADLHDKQKLEGISFGDVRCNLIAKALLQVCTGKSAEDFLAHYRYSPDESDRYFWVGNYYKKVGTKAGAEYSGGTKWKARADRAREWGKEFWRIKAPISKHEKILLTSGPSLVEFENQVSELFKESNVDPDEPWK
jgi:hypothetical protein